MILVPIIVKFIPTVDLEKVPWILLYVLRRDDFFFAISPILILIGIIYFFWALFGR